MKIAMVTQGADQGRQVDELVAALRRAGHEVTVHADAPHDADGDLGRVAAQLYERWRQDRPDVVHAHHWTSGLASLQAARGMALPVVLTFQELATAEQRHQVGDGGRLAQRMQLERLVGRRASWVVASCEDEVTDLVTLGVPRARTSVVPGGVDCDAFQPSGATSDDVGPFRLFSIGQLAPHGGFDDLIRAVARVPAAQLVIAGGPSADKLDGDEDARRLMLLADQLGVADRVRFVGRLPQPERARMLRWADAVVCAPWYEPLGVFALEGMASGDPIVATDVGCLRDSVVHGITGEHVPRRRPDALAATLQRLSADIVTLQEYGVAGRDRARSRYAWDRIAADAVRVYEHVQRSV